MSYMPPSKKQEHVTPDRVWGMVADLVGGTAEECRSVLYDPCPAGTPYKAPCFFNGLYGDWKKLNYVNPPFEVKTLRLFYKKAVEQSRHERFTVMLLPSKTDQDWFHDIIENGFRIRWIKGRLKFKGNRDSAMGGHFLVVVA